MPDRSKKRKRNKNKRKNKNTQNNKPGEKLADTGSEAGGSCDEQPSDVNKSGDVENGCDSRNLPECDSHKHEQLSTAESKVDEQTSEYEQVEQIKVIKSDFVAPDDTCDAFKYVVESPEQIKSCEKIKISEIPKSKSLDDIDKPKIEEITEDIESKIDQFQSLVVIDNAVISEAESDIEWETADCFDHVTVVNPSTKIVGKLTVTSPMIVADCEHTQALSPEEELSLRQYLQTLNLVTCPQEIETIDVDKIEEPLVNKPTLRKKSISEDIFKQKHRFLDVIDEEGSNESSLASRRQSYLKENFEDLEDEVFHDKNKQVGRLEIFPQLKSVKTQNKISHPIPQECLLVGAKVVQQKIEEGCGDWIIENIEQLKGAEVVYLTDSSSSASDIYDIGEEAENSGENEEQVVRIVTPTIEINDSSNFITKPDSDGKTSSNETNIIQTSPQIIISSENDSVESNESLDSNDSKEIVVTGMENKSSKLYVLKIDEEVLCENENKKSNITQYVQAKDKLTHEIDLSDYRSKNDECGKLFTLKEPKSTIDNEINYLKSELNNAMSNLMKEVAAEKENNTIKDNTLSRQESSSSIGSSQCTAKYNPTTSSLTDITTLLHETSDTNKHDVKHETVLRETKESHVKDVFERVTGSGRGCTFIEQIRKENPKLLKDICLQKIASLPYGEKILEELASVSARLQNISLYGTSGLLSSTMPFYPLPDVTGIKKVSLSTKNQTILPCKLSGPPVAPRNSSLKFPHDELSWTALPTKRDSSLYVCLSPSQKMLMEKTHTVIDKEDANELLESHQKYVGRRGYDEVYSKNDRHQQKNYQDNAVPFKSQTGNRLLAIIRNPDVTINSKTNWSRKNVNQSSSYSNIYREHDPIRPRYSNSAKDVRSEMTFRPIPPPPPRHGKYSSTLYESDESSDFTDHSFQSVSERKYFHYSTGHLSKEIEKDISNIQDMHQKYTTARDSFKNKYLQTDKPVRRPSLPKDLCEQQMEYIRQKEREVEAEIKKLETKKENASLPFRSSPRAPLYSESDLTKEQHFNDNNNYRITRKLEIAANSENILNKHVSSSFMSSQEEIKREKMYSEYVNQMAEREERKQHKIIKIKPLTNDIKTESISMPLLQSNEVRTGNNKIEEEFILKAKERWDKLGIKDPETEDEREKKDEYIEPKVVEHKIKVIEGGQEKDVTNLPTHLREFVQFTAKSDKESARSPGESNGDASFFVVFCAVVIVMLAIGKRMIPFFQTNNN